MVRSRSPHSARIALSLTGVLLLGAAQACTSNSGDGAATTTTSRSSAGTSAAAPSRSASPSVQPQATQSTSAPAAPPKDRTPSGEPVRIAFAGDVHFEGASGAALTDFGPISRPLSAADVTIVNLETAITDGGVPQNKAYTFRAPASAFTALRKAGVDAVSMANNHGMDFGTQGLKDSLAAAKKARFPVIGIGADENAAYAPYRKTVRGQRIAVIAATQVLDAAFLSSWSAGPGKPGLASAKRESRLVKAVRDARPDSDTLAVFLHWGQELNACPLATQQSLMRKLVDAGADIVVGSHAHVLLGGGYTKDGAYIDYGLGNFVFYARPGLGAQTGVLEVTTRGRAVTKARWQPAVITGGRPVPLTGSAATAAVRAKNRLRGCTGLHAAAS